MSFQNDQLKEIKVKNRQQLRQPLPFFFGGYQPIYDSALEDDEPLPPIPRGGTGESGRRNPNKIKQNKKR
jgi:hypothetical protein